MFKKVALLLGVIATTAAMGEPKPENVSVATFAGGCFWCMQSDFDKVPGVIETVVGYTGGTLANPTYKQVGTKKTGHYEALEVFYDESEISYEELLDVFWMNIDPTDDTGQFCDKGSPYRAAIFYLNDSQKVSADQSKEDVIETDKFSRVVTPVLKASTFYPAEEYHQSYYKKNPTRYHFYRYRCGRDKRLRELWILG